MSKLPDDGDPWAHIKVKLIYIVHIIFSFWSFEISGGILRNQKIINGLDSVSKQSLKFWPHLDLTSLCNDYY